MTHRDRLPPSPQRRRFLETSARYGFTTAVLASSAGVLWSDPSLAQTAKSEEEKQKAASHTMIIATSYKNDDVRGFPILQVKLKQNIETATKGKIYVRLAPAGQLGVESAIAQKVQAGTIQGGSHSMSNFSPYAPAVDVVNIPFWCGENQRFANLVTSKAWTDLVDPRVRAKGFKVLFYFTIDPRTISKRRGASGGVIKTPDDLHGVKVRIPNSKMLALYYRLAGGNPTPIAWGETPTALKQGVADALDPSVGGLWVYGFADILESVTLVFSVPDSQVFHCNLAWYDSLPQELRAGIDEAADKTQQESFAQIPIARKYAIAEMEKGGVKFYKPTAAEHKKWVDAAGAQRREWNDIKIELVGSLDAFDKLQKAANTKGRFTVNDA